MPLPVPALALPPEAAAARAMPPATPRELFVVHAKGDEWFVRGELLPFLGLSADRARLISELPLGELTFDALERFIAASQVTVVVISAAYVADPLARYTEQLASHADLEGGGRVVPLVLDKGAPSLRIRARVALDLSDPARWEAELHRLRELLHQPMAPREELVCPYPGLCSLTREDSAKLLGRDRELNDLLARVKTGERELHLVGPSGSGKSSLVAAGVLPRLEAGLGGISGAVVRGFRPGDAPLARLREALQPHAKVGSRAPTTLPELEAEALEEELRHHLDELLADQPATHRLVLHIDQLEEVFTLAAEAERERFFAALQLLRADPRCLFFYCLRADFFANLIISPLWSESARSVTIAPLRGADLRAAIELPAHGVGVYLEPGLVERLLADARGAAGILPLVQETLLQLWEQRRHRVLTLACYERMGEGGRSGLAVAMSRRADACLAGLSPPRQKIARRILLRLVHFGEGAADTRCQRPRAELALAGEPRAELEAVIEHLVAGRLIITDGGVERSRKRVARVELAHDSLIAAWDQLRGWIHDCRVDGQRLRQLENAAAAWVGLGRGEGGLLHDSELRAALAWRRGEAARELGQSADLEAWLAASAQAQRRRHRHARLIGGGIVTLGGAVVLLTVLWSWQGRELEEERAESGVQRAFGASMAQRSTEQQVQTETERSARELTDGRPQRALPHLLAAREARETEPPSAALQLMFGLARKVRLQGQLPTGGKTVALAISADGALTAIGLEDGTVRLLSSAGGGGKERSFVHEGGLLALAISPDGTRIVTGGADATARLWNGNGDAVAVLPHASAVRVAAFDRTGSLLGTGSDDGTARVWSAADGAPRLAPLQHGGAVQSVAFGPANLVVTGSADGLARVWSAADGKVLAKLQHASSVTLAGVSSDGEQLVTVSRKDGVRFSSLRNGVGTSSGASKQPTKDPADDVGVAALSPDGQYLATAKDAVIKLRSLVTTELAGARMRHDGTVRMMMFSGDGSLLLTVGTDKMARLWAVPSGMPLSAGLEHAGDASLVAIDHDGRQFISGGAVEVRRWIAELERRERRALSQQSRVLSVAFMPQSDQVVTASSGTGAILWSAATGAKLRTFSHAAEGLRLALSHDGEWLATASPRGLKLWSRPNGDARSLPFPHRGDVVDLAFSADGAYLATASADSTVAIWDVARGAVAPPLLRHESGVAAVAFPPGNQLIATATIDGDVQLWDRTTGQRVASIETPVSGVTSLHFSPDGQQLMIGAEEQALAVKRVDAKLVVTQYFPVRRHDVTCVRVSPDGAFLATAADKQVQIWDTQTGALLSQRRHTQVVRSLDWSHDGAWLLTGDSGGDVWLWKVARDTSSLAEWRALVQRADAPLIAPVDLDGSTGASAMTPGRPRSNRPPRLPNQHADSGEDAAPAARPRRVRP